MKQSDLYLVAFDLSLSKHFRHICQLLTVSNIWPRKSLTYVCISFWDVRLQCLIRYNWCFDFGVFIFNNRLKVDEDKTDEATIRKCNIVALKEQKIITQLIRDYKTLEIEIAI